MSLNKNRSEKESSVYVDKVSEKKIPNLRTRCRLEKNINALKMGSSHILTYPQVIKNTKNILMYTRVVHPESSLAIIEGTIIFTARKYLLD